MQRVQWYDSPIVNADKWLRSENLRILIGTAQAARLANESLRRERRSCQRGRWTEKTSLLPQGGRAKRQSLFDRLMIALIRGGVKK